MDILDSVLYTCNAQNHSKQFKHHCITASTLKLLSEEDLKILGVEDEETRLAILNNAAKLQIPAESPVNREIDEKYMSVVLAQMCVHLTKHLASLSIAVNRKDVIVCDVKLAPLAKSLKDCVTTLEEQLDEFEQKVSFKRKTRSRLKVAAAVATIIPAAVVAAFLLKRAFT